MPQMTHYKKFILTYSCYHIIKNGYSFYTALKNHYHIKVLIQSFFSAKISPNLLALPVSFVPDYISFTNLVFNALDYEITC